MQSFAQYYQEIRNFCLSTSTTENFYVYLGVLVEEVSSDRNYNIELWNEYDASLNQ